MFFNFFNSVVLSYDWAKASLPVISVPRQIRPNFAKVFQVFPPTSLPAATKNVTKK